MKTKKNIQYIFIIMLFFSVSLTGITVNASEPMVDENEIYQMPPSRIWWSGIWDTAFGIPPFRYYERVEVGVLYRGYLQFSGEIEGTYAYYEGYLYPEGEPYPIPTKDKPEILGEE